MKLRKALLLALLATPLTARADFYIHHWENRREQARAFSLSPEFSFYSSSKNFDSTGAQFTPDGLAKYSRIQSDVNLAYGFNRWLTGYARLTWAKLQVEHASFPSENFALGDQTVGLNVHLLESRPMTLLSGNGTQGIELDLQLQVDLPAYSDSALAGTTSTHPGDASVDFTGGAFATLPLTQARDERLNLIAGAGFTYRDNGYSMAIPWSVSLKWVPTGEGILFGASIFGLQSLRTDLNNASGYDVTGSTPIDGAGGSFFYHAINPSLISVRGQLGYMIGQNIGLSLFAAPSVWGQGAPAGAQFGMGLHARWGSDLSRKNPAKMAPLDYGRSNQGFVNYAFESRVTRVNDRMNQLRIDKGSQDGVEAGQTFDVFLVKKDGSIGEAVARAKCQNVQSNEATLTITEYFREVWIEEGFLVKRPLN